MAGNYGGEALPPALAAPAFIEVGLTDDAGAIVPRAPALSKRVANAPPLLASKALSVIEIETAAGIKLRLVGRVDDRALRRVLAAIRRLA